MITINGLPAHPLVIHLVVVLLPLAAVGAVLVATRATWRRAWGIPVFLLALLGTVAVPIATETGDQLRDAIGGGGPLVAIHQHRAEYLLPYAIAFTVTALATVLLGWHTDRVADPARARTQAVITRVLAVLAVVSGIVVSALVIWIGDAGASAVWQGIGATRGG
jgi:hypothetical protein